MCAVAAEQVYGDQEMHGVVRQQCCDMLVCGLGALQGPCDGECAVKGLTLRALAGHTVASSPVVMCRWWRAGAVRVNETVSECGHQGESDVQKPNCGVERRWCIEAEAKKMGCSVKGGRLLCGTATSQLGAGMVAASHICLCTGPEPPQLEPIVVLQLFSLPLFQTLVLSSSSPRHHVSSQQRRWKTVCLAPVPSK